MTGNQTSVRAPSQINRVGGEKPMSTSLYDLSVPTFLQTVRSIGGFLDRAATHFAETGVDPDNFVNTRLFDDMAPFHFQIEAASHHSVWGVEALKTGEFTPPALVGPVPFADLQAMIVKAETALQAFTPDEVNGWAGKDLGGCGCLNRISASISGASAGVRPPRGKAAS